MCLSKPLIISASLFLSAGSLSAATLQQDGGEFLLLTTEEAATLQQKLSSVEGSEREALRQAEYERLKQKAQQAGYEMPVLTAPATSPDAHAPAAPSQADPTNTLADTGENTTVSPSASAPQPEVTKSETPVSRPASVEKPAPPTVAAEASDDGQAPATTSSQEPAIASPYNRGYQAPRQSREELVKSMEARRDALRKQMQQRRMELARQRPGSRENQPLQDAGQRARRHEAEIASRQRKLEEERHARRQEMEARRKAMDARINRGINAIGRRPAARPYYANPAWAARPAYPYPYGPYAYPGR